MPIHLLTHEDCLAHEIDLGHPERPDRLRAIEKALRKAPFADDLVWHLAPKATREQLERAHPATYLDHLRVLSESGGGSLDADTAVNSHSWSAALRAAGAAVRAAEIALNGEGCAFAAVRPPGHHAEAARAMGFCLINNVVVAALDALAQDRVERVLIVDWDVHHGNGTQDLVQENPAIRFISIHQWPLYPGSGREDERGVGNLWNLPRPPGLAPELYVEDLLGAIDDACRDWPPDLVLISAGFDAMRGDPLAGFTLKAEHYTQITDALLALGAPVAALLEGGYRLRNLAAGTCAMLEAMQNAQNHAGDLQGLS